ncbi:MAG: hypothetical protein Q8O40_07330 [Chloroflexota bacterium]|nr:hypothetical protein [Chloroflexota bacterium]
MAIRKWLLLLAVSLGIVTVACTARAGASTAAGILSGDLSGLPPGKAATLRVERLDRSPWEWLQFGQTVPEGRLIQAFTAAGSRWKRDIRLPAGHYVLKASAEEHLGVPGARYFQVPEEVSKWRHASLDFELVKPEDAQARFGVPFCNERPEHGGVLVMPPGTPTPTPTFPRPGTPWPPATPPPYPLDSCYAGQFQYVGALATGMKGHVSGLPSGATATITARVLPHAPDEMYTCCAPPPPDGSLRYPPAVQALQSTDGLEAGNVLATLDVRNGEWGLVDPSLMAARYRVTSSAKGYQASPAGYIVVEMGGRVFGVPTGDVDFSFQRTQAR